MSNLLTTTLQFTKPSDRPFFFTSYVTTLDGKIYVKKPDYWPIGSRIDYDYFTYLRSHVDVIVEGKNTALAFGSHTINSIHSEQFLSYRKKLGKEKPVEFMVLARSIDERLKDCLQNTFHYKPLILTSIDSTILESIENSAVIKRLPAKKDENLIPSFIEYLTQKNYNSVFLDVGPQLLAEFIKERALDELFITVSPKLFGTDSKTVSLGDFPLFSSETIPTFSLISSETVADEVFLRYQKLRT